MADPETCDGTGGAISIWLKRRSGYTGGYLTTRSTNTSRGMTIHYSFTLL